MEKKRRKSHIRWKIVIQIEFNWTHRIFKLDELSKCTDPPKHKPKLNLMLLKVNKIEP